MESFAPARLPGNEWESMPFPPPPSFRPKREIAARHHAAHGNPWYSNITSTVAAATSTVTSLFAPSPPPLPPDPPTGTSLPVQDDECRVVSDWREVCGEVGCAAKAAHDATRCPFLHGTVDAKPFPGYVHGRHPSICPHGCEPSMHVGEGESVVDRLLREAKEYQDLYHHEMRSTKEVVDARWCDIVLEVAATGTYAHTFDELEHGMRVAWRNAPKCSNRKFWKEISLLDARGVDTNKGMFDACLHHLELAYKNGVTDMYVTCFAAAPPGSKKGPRVWNDQLLRYAAYRQPDGTVLGDPANLAFTSMMEQCFDYHPPSGEPTNWDHLPLVLQCNPDEPAESFTIPATFTEAKDVRIWHPDYPELSKLDLRWYAIPAVCALEVTIGGLLYTGIPFNGWYADTEVVRDLADEGRYNKLPAIASTMGLDTSRNASLWRDMALTVLNQAVLHSYSHAAISMVDHHTLIQGFFTWYQRELKERGYCSGNWKWIIPPQAAATSRAYLELNKMTEYTLRPAYLYAPGWKSYHGAWFGKPDPETIRRAVGQLLFAVRFIGKLLHAVHKKRMNILIVYVSVSGNTRKYANHLHTLLAPVAAVSLVDLGAFDALSHASFDAKAGACHVMLLLSATYGNGDVPATGVQFMRFLGTPDANELLAKKPFATLGFGSKAYPMYCGGALKFDEALLALDCQSLLAVGKCDAAGSEAVDFIRWSEALVSALATLPNAQDSLKQLASDGFGMAKAKTLVPVTVEVLSTKEASSKALSRMIHTNDATTGISLRSAGAWLSSNVLEVRPLIPTLNATAQNFARQTSLVRLDLSECANPHYMPGDHVSTVPMSSLEPRALAAFAKGLGLKLDQVLVVAVDGSDADHLAERAPLIHQIVDHPLTFGSLLTEHAALLNRIDMEGCLVLSKHASGSDAKVLEAMGKRQQLHAIAVQKHGMRWIDLFEQFPSLRGQLKLSVALNLLAANHPRTYSISSSKDAVGKEVHLCVGRHIFKTNDGLERRGACSDFLTLCEVGQKLKIRLSASPSFRLPVNCAAPIILIGAGTGIAPLRGFWQEREHLLKAYPNTKLGPAVLVFGCRDQSEFIFREELERAREVGALSHVLVAYSREPGVEKQHVQHRLLLEAPTLQPLLERADCHVYVCGLSQMADAAMISLNKLSSPETIAQMTVDGRIHTDIFGSLPSSGAEPSIVATIMAGRGRRASTVQRSLTRSLDIQDAKSGGLGRRMSTMVRRGSTMGASRRGSTMARRTSTVPAIGLAPSTQAEYVGEFGYRTLKDHRLLGDSKDTGRRPSLPNVLRRTSVDNAARRRSSRAIPAGTLAKAPRRSIKGTAGGTRIVPHNGTPDNGTPPSSTACTATSTSSSPLNMQLPPAHCGETSSSSPPLTPPSPLQLPAGAQSAAKATSEQRRPWWKWW